LRWGQINFRLPTRDSQTRLSRTDVPVSANAPTAALANLRIPGKCVS